jgi:hypothetical protein
VFTRHLVTGLRDGSADLDKDGNITLDELYRYVHDRVVEEIPSQRPKKQDNVDGDIVIARNVNWTVPAHLRHALESPIAADRISALDGMARLFRTGNKHVRKHIAEEVRRLEDDDSKSVSRAASDHLALMQSDGIAFQFEIGSSLTASQGSISSLNAIAAPEDWDAETVEAGQSSGDDFGINLGEGADPSSNQDALQVSEPGALEPKASEWGCTSTTVRTGIFSRTSTLSIALTEATHTIVVISSPIDSLIVDGVRVVKSRSGLPRVNHVTLADGPHERNVVLGLTQIGIGQRPGHLTIDGREIPILEAPPYPTP